MKEVGVPIFVMVLVKLNNVLRMTAFVGTFVTAIFYLTRKVVVIYCLAVIVNIITLVFLLLSEKEIANFKENMGSDTEKEEYDEAHGKSPTILLWFNLILPILFAPTFFVLYGQTGLILHDNDKIA